MPTKKRSREAGSEGSEADTPGLPEESGSHEQKQPNQNSDSGNPALDRELSRRTPHRPDPREGPTRSGK